MEAMSAASASPRATWRTRTTVALRANWELLILPVVVLIAVIPQYRWPIHYNEAFFVVFGREILEGALPYRDFVDQKEDVPKSVELR